MGKVGNQNSIKKTSSEDISNKPVVLQFRYNGKEYKIRAKTRAEAEQKKIDKLVELRMAEAKTPVLSADTIVDDWAIKAFDTYKKRSSGLKDTKARYHKYVQPIIGRVPISKVTAIQCQEILNQVSDRSFSLVDKLNQELRFIFNTAIDNDLIVKNPARKLVMPDNEKGTHRSITEKEREHVYLVYEKDHAFVLFILMLECSCRPKEACNVKGSDIDHKHRLLHIQGTKSENSDRYVSIPDDLYEDIKDTSLDSYIATNAEGRHHNKDSYKRLSNRFKRELNLSMGCKTYRNALVPPFPLAEDFQPYCLRHTFCTDLCKAGVDIRTAQRLMGHSDITMTANIYTHADTKQITEAGEKYNEYLKSLKKRSEGEI